MCTQRDDNKYQRALFLRIRKGYSYGEIKNKIGVAKSTLSNRLSEIDVTEKQKERIRHHQVSSKNRFNIGA